MAVRQWARQTRRWFREGPNPARPRLKPLKSQQDGKLRRKKTPTSLDPAFTPWGRDMDCCNFHSESTARKIFLASSGDWIGILIPSSTLVQAMSSSCASCCSLKKSLQRQHTEVDNEWSNSHTKKLAKEHEQKLDMLWHVAILMDTVSLAYNLRNTTGSRTYIYIYIASFVFQVNLTLSHL